MPLPDHRFALALCVTVLGCNRGSAPASADPAPFTSANPFASASPLLYQAPPFDRIHDADYQPAVEEGMRRQLAEVAAIASDTAVPSFDNTIVALERSGAPHLCQVGTPPSWRDSERLARSCWGYFCSASRPMCSA